MYPQAEDKFQDYRQAAHALPRGLLKNAFALTAGGETQLSKNDLIAFRPYSEEALQQEDLKFAQRALMGNGFGGAGRLIRMNLRDAENLKRKDKKAYENYLIQQRLQDLLEKQQALLDELSQIREERDSIAQELSGIKKRRHAIQSALNEADNLELDTNGQLRNKKAETAVQEYEKRTGTKVDRTDGVLIYTILHQEDRELEAREKKLSGRSQELEQEEARVLEEIEINRQQIDCLQSYQKGEAPLPESMKEELGIDQDMADFSFGSALSGSFNQAALGESLKASEASTVIELKSAPPAPGI